jgi:DNA-binding transcriptional ArsR family regulator
MSSDKIDTFNTAFVEMEAKIDQASSLLKAMASPRRLMVLCSLVEGERTAGDLAARVGLSASALSPHLAQMRALGLIAVRRDGASLHYSLSSREVEAVMQTLYELYCGPASKGSREPA